MKYKSVKMAKIHYYAEWSDKMYITAFLDQSLAKGRENGLVQFELEFVDGDSPANGVSKTLECALEKLMRDYGVGKEDLNVAPRGN